ncbi:MAG: DegT/DnrJ/EryC1/StrS aminotransferase family protein [Burkholderiales bacterium]|nr:DegT/DnrJ/EryC1/StrS aminotransferase family protein [Burkholderiales bacterium]
MSTAVAPPNRPVLDWPDFTGRLEAGVPSIDLAPQRLFTTSGRAALYQALRQLALPPGSGVLVPTYHCPTMIAPVVLAGCVPVFYALGEDGLPDLAALEAGPPPAAGAMLVAHLFGLPRSLQAVRAWCDAHQVALIEDCAHCYFGRAGDRPVGQWGDFATASLTKFLPVPEGGLLVSAHRALRPVPLAPQGPVNELKGWIDVFEHAHGAGRLQGLRTVLGWALALKSHRRAGATRPAHADDPALPADPMQGCDMARADSAPLGATTLLRSVLPRERIVQQRRQLHDQLMQAVSGLAGMRPLFPGPCPADSAPYALALWVEDADRVYHALRQQGMAVFRWDRVWAGTPALPHDRAAPWQRQVLQCLCHQSLRPQDIDRLAHALQALS